MSMETHPFADSVRPISLRPPSDVDTDIPEDQVVDVHALDEVRALVEAQEALDERADERRVALMALTAGFCVTVGAGLALVWLAGLF